MSKTSFDKIDITCSSNGRIARADILERTDKILKVAFEGTNIGITLYRKDKSKVYVGNQNGLEFTAKGDSNATTRRN